MPTPARKHPRLKTALINMVKWGGLGVSVVVVVVWIGSGWWWFGWDGPHGNIDGSLRHGGLTIYENSSLTGPFTSNFLLRVPLRAFRWWFDWSSSFGRTGISVPLWPLPLLSLLATAAAWRADAKSLRRARVGMCPACGYDRAGLAAGAVCPECGAAAGGVVRALTDHAIATDNSKAKTKA